MASFSNPGRRVGAPGNFAQSGRLGFAVGDPTFLDSEASKVRAYWRGLEYGSTKFLGRTITGLWSNVGGPRGGLITGRLAGFQEGSGGQQKLVPFVRPQEEVALGATRALNYLLGSSDLGDRMRSRVEAGNFDVPTAGVIRRPIVAQNAYRDAVRAFGPMEREKEAVRQVFGQMGFIQGGRNFATGRGGQKKVTFVSQRTQRPAPLSSKGFVARTGFLTGRATSGFTQSLVTVDRTFQAELTKINKLLAEGLALQVAETQRGKIRRTQTSSGRLEAATLSAKNRFPS